ncbi:MAG: cell division protein FtsL [Bacilli bacterium]
MKKGKRSLMFFIYLFVFMSPLAIIAMKASITKANINYEKVNKEYANISEVNINLEMKINELASLDRIREVAESYGLAYNNENIKNVE